MELRQQRTCRAELPVNKDLFRIFNYSDVARTVNSVPYTLFLNKYIIIIAIYWYDSVSVVLVLYIFI